MNMRLLLLSFFSLAISADLVAQDFSKIDAQARNVPTPKNAGVADLAKALSAGCQNETEKARSFFVWIAENIRYDVQLLEDQDEVSREKRKAMQTPEKVIKRKKGVCEGYTNLFNALCRSVGIRALEVPGITKKQNGDISRSGHLWSLVYADGHWGLVDATWGAGIVDLDDGRYHEKFDEKYFFASPEKLLANHYPNDPLHQCIGSPLSLAEFKLSGSKFQDALDSKKIAKPIPGYENIPDSLNAVFLSDSTRYFFNAGHRSLQINPDNNFGAWSVGSYYYQNATQGREQFFQAIKDLAPLGYYPKLEWFDEQLPNLKSWELYSQKCLDALKSASGQDSYSRFVQHLRQNAQNSLAASQRALEQNHRLKSAVMKGVKVKMTSE